MTRQATDPVYDIAIIGGGVNGCGIARDAAGRGASVVLFEQGDFAGATSSASTKLIHGGLRYLENYEFRLVREALIERERLWRMAPHIVRPLRFVLPCQKGLRPAWMLRLGLLLYDHLGGRKHLPPTQMLDLSTDEAGLPLRGEFRRGFEYSDCRVDDSRLVVLNAVDAAERGARVLPRCRLVAARRAGAVWELDAQDAGSGETRRFQSRILVNAAGPWVHEVLTDIAGLAAPARTRLVQGSHIVVRRLFRHERAYIFQNPDGRIVFAIPYGEDFTLIGTTDRDYRGPPGEVAADAEEIAYLCTAASEHFRAPVTPDMVVWAYSGVRALYDDGAGSAQDTTRDYVLKLDDGARRPPLLSVFGGKITTYRRLAEHALDMLKPYLTDADPDSWTALKPLPGGDFAPDRHEELAWDMCRRHSWLDDRMASRLVAAYGTRAERVIGGARRMRDLGTVFGADLTEAELHYLMTREWARTAEDVLWRRSKLGLYFSAAEVAALDAHMRGVAPPT